MSLVPGITGLRPIGRGGSADVFVGEQAGLNRTVAVKVLTMSGSPGLMAQFGREIETVGKLAGQTSRVVAPYFVGVTGNGQPFVVMEFMECGSLSRYIASGATVTVNEAVHVSQAIATALLCAHEGGFVHRDVKPDNVLIARDGSVKLADFGIARLLSDLHATITTAYTPDHAAPEAFSDKVLPESDVYGLASTLYTMIEGHPPFRRSIADTIDSIISRKIAGAPIEFRRQISPDLQALIIAGLELNPQSRPPLASFVDPALGAGEPLRALPIVLPPIPEEPTVVRAPQPNVPTPPPGVYPVIDGEVTHARVHKPTNRDIHGPQPRQQRNSNRGWVVAGALFVVAATGAGVMLATNSNNATAPTTIVVAPTAVQPPQTTTTSPEVVVETGQPTATTPVASVPATAPVTAEPIVTVPPAPVTAELIVTVPPASVTTPVPPAALPALTEEEAEQTFRTYLALAIAEKYQLAWPMLTAKYQTKYRGYDSFVRIWGRFKTASLKSAVTIGSTPDTQILETRLGFDLTDGSVANEIVDVTVVKNLTTGEVFIDDYIVKGKE